MPRNTAGVYTPALPPVIPGTLVLAEWANESLTDIAAALSDSLSRGGSGNMLVSFKVVDGTEALPGLAFAQEASSGFYRAADGQIGVSILGVKQLLLTALGLELANPPTLPNHATTMLYVDDAITGATEGIIDDGTTSTSSTWSSAKISDSSAQGSVSNYAALLKWGAVKW